MRVKQAIVTLLVMLISSGATLAATVEKLPRPDWWNDVDLNVQIKQDWDSTVEALANSGSLVPTESLEIGDWSVIGPFDNNNKAGFDVAYPPEKGISLDQSYEGKGGSTVSWQSVSNWSDVDAKHDILPYMSVTSNGVAYMHTTVTAPAATDLILHVGSDDTISAWVNGEQVLAVNQYRGASADQNQARAALHKGKNDILLKVCQGGGGWAFYFKPEAKPNAKADAKILTALVEAFPNDTDHVKKARLELAEIYRGMGLEAAATAAQGDFVEITVGLNLKDPNQNIVKSFSEISWTAALTAEFQKEYPNADVKWERISRDQMVVRMAAGVGPDIVNDCCGEFHDEGVQGMFLTLNPYMEKYNFNPMEQRLFWEPQWQAFQFQGKQFAFPQYLGTMAMWYNADMFDAKGLKAPSPDASDTEMNWDYFKKTLQRLKEDKNGDGIPEVYGLSKQFWTARVGYWLISAGARFYQDGLYSGTKSALDSPEAVEGLKYLRSLVDEQLIGGNWLQGTTAIWEQHSGELFQALGTDGNGNPKVPFQWNIFPIPVGPSGQRATLATTDGYAINANTKNPDMAFKLLRFLASDTAATIVAEYMGLQPANRRAIPRYIDAMAKANSNVRDINIQVHTMAGPYAYPEALYPNYRVADGILADAYNRILTSSSPEAPGPVMMDAVERINQISPDGSIGGVH